MRYEFPNQEGPLDVAWIEPLRMIERVLAQPGATVADSFFDLDDFMIMTRLIRSPRPSIVLYKHRHTRRYINLDDAGHAYRYYPPPRPDSRGNGQYRRHQDLRTAINNVGLWELPWMKEGLERHQYGWTFDERWTVRWQLDSPPREGGVRTAAEFWRQRYNASISHDRCYDALYTDWPHEPPGSTDKTDPTRISEPDEM